MEDCFLEEDRFCRHRSKLWGVEFNFAEVDRARQCATKVGLAFELCGVEVRGVIERHTVKPSVVGKDGLDEVCAFFEDRTTKLKFPGKRRILPHCVMLEPCPLKIYFGLATYLPEEPESAEPRPVETTRLLEGAPSEFNISMETCSVENSIPSDINRAERCLTEETGATESGILRE